MHVYILYAILYMYYFIKLYFNFLINSNEKNFMAQKSNLRMRKTAMKTGRTTKQNVKKVTKSQSFLWILNTRLMKFQDLSTFNESIHFSLLNDKIDR